MSNVSGRLSRDTVVVTLRDRLRDLPDFVRAVLLFGSVARNEADERSDIDLLVLHEGLRISNIVERRRVLYKLVMDRIGDIYDAVTLLDMELKDFIKPRTITPLLLNIYQDAIVIIDRIGHLEQFLSHVRRRICEVGLVRVKDGKAYYWILPKPMQRIQIL